MTKNLSWEEFRLGELISLRTGKQDVNAASQEGAYPFFTCSRETLRIGWAEFSGPSVIVAGNGDLNVKFFDGHFNAYQRTYVLQSTDQRLNIYYLYAFLVAYVSLLRSETQGSTIQYLKKDQFTEARIPLPSLREQAAIAQALSDTDALVVTLDALIVKKRDMKQAAMQQLLTGHTRLPGFSDEWQEMRLGDLATLKPGINKPLTAMGRGTLYLTVQELYDGSEIDSSKLSRIDVTDDEIARFSLEPGDIIFGKSSVKREGIGYPNRFSGAREPVVASGFTFVARPDTQIVDSRYLLHALRQQSSRTWLINNSQASALTNINAGIASAVPVVLPSLREQQAIAEVLSLMDAELDALAAQREKAELVKQGMMQELLSGRVRLV